MVPFGPEMRMDGPRRGAVNLKFLSASRQIRHRNFKFKAAPEKSVGWYSYASEVCKPGCRGKMQASESEHWYCAQHRLLWLTRRKSPGKICRRQAFSPSLRPVPQPARQKLIKQNQYFK
jgi:hypothetical protein